VPACGHEMSRPRKPLQRLPQPNLGRGKLQVVIRRLFLLSDTISSADVARTRHCRRQRPLSVGNYAAVRRTLRQMGAVPIGRAGGQGRPLLWRKRNSDGE